jgi:hypothetical protein
VGDDGHCSVVESQPIDEPVGVLSVVCSGAAKGFGDEQKAGFADGPVGGSVLVGVVRGKGDSKGGTVGDARDVGDERGVGDGDGGVNEGGVDLGEEVFDRGICGEREVRIKGSPRRGRGGNVPFVPFSV